MLRWMSLAVMLCAMLLVLLSVGCGGRKVEVTTTPEMQQQNQEYLNRLQQMEQQFVNQGGPGSQSLGSDAEQAPPADE